MSAKHTPGPWHYCDDPRHFAYRRIINSSDVAIAQPMTMGDGSLANAYLLAAAPDLLRELRNAAALLEAAGVEDRPGRTIEAIRSAIAKAEGRS